MTTPLSPTHTQAQTSSPTSLPLTPTAASPTPTPTQTPTLTPTLMPTLTTSLTPSLSPSSTSCPHPSGWVSYLVQSGDTLAKIATRYGISASQLQLANCLLKTELLPGGLIYIPPVPTQTSVPCGSPSTWIVYYLQPGDTLYRLSVAYGISVSELQRANCMGSSTRLHAGQAFYVPPWPMLPPPPTVPVVPIETITNTPGINPPTDTPTIGNW